MKNRIYLIALLSFFAGAMLAQNVIADKLTVKAGGVIDFKTGASLKIGSIIINEFSNDPTLADSSNAALVTEAAVKAYVDANGGGGGAQSFTHTQASHSFTVGQLIYFSNASTAKLAKSDYGVADSVAQWVVSEVVSSSQFKYCNTCEVSLTTGYTPGSYVWTSTTPGGVTNVQPTATNSQYAGVVRTTSTVWVHVGDIAGGGGGSTLANNGLSMSGDTVQLGGLITKPTFVEMENTPTSKNVYIGNTTDAYATNGYGLKIDPSGDGVGVFNNISSRKAMYELYAGSYYGYTYDATGRTSQQSGSVGGSGPSILNYVNNGNIILRHALNIDTASTRAYDLSVFQRAANKVGLSGWHFGNINSAQYAAATDTSFSYSIRFRNGSTYSNYMRVRPWEADAFSLYDEKLKFKNADPVPTPGDTTLYGMVNVAGTKSPINLPLSLIGGGGGSDGNGIYSGDGTAPADVDVAVTDSINFDNGTLQIHGNLDRVSIGSSTTAPSAQLSIRKNGIGVTQSNAHGLVLANNTAATAGNQQMSPGIRWLGQGWKTNATAASQSVEFLADVLPVQGAANPTGTWQLKSSVNGGAYSNLLSVTSTGNLGIGTAAPIGIIETAADATSINAFSVFSNTASSEPIFYFRRGRGTISAPSAIQSGDVIGSIRFAGHFGGATSYSTSAKIESVATANFGATYSSDMKFYTTTTTTQVERLTIKDSGSVGIGTTSPDRLLHPELSDATTNTVTYPMRISKITSGAATTGFGLGTEYELENASGTNRVAATEEITYSDAVNATEDATYKLRLMQAGTLTDAVTVTSVGAVESLYQRFGAGSPEGVVTAPIGAFYSRTDGGAGTSFYVKESGTGNTGWVAK